MKKILIVDHHAVHSAGRELYRELAKNQEWDTRVIAPKIWTENGITTRFAAETKGLNIIRSSVFFGGRTHRNMYVRLDRELRRFRPDITLVNSEPEGFLALQTVLLCSYYKLDGAIVFTTWRNMHYGEPDVPFPVKWPWLSRCIDRYTVPRCAHIIAHSPSAPEIFQAHGFSNISYIPPWVDVERFAGVADRKRSRGLEGADDTDLSAHDASRRLIQDGVSTSHAQDDSVSTANTQTDSARRGRGRARKVLRIGYVGRLVREKGVDILLAAVRDLDVPVELNIVGEGPERKNLVELARSSNLSERCEFVSPVPHSEIPKIMARFDVLVLPSRTRPGWKEQFGRVLIEGMASGAVVVGSDSGDIPNVIGNAGFIFREGDSKALCAILRKLAVSESLRNTSREAGMRRVTNEYSLAVATQRYTDLFNALKFRREIRTIEKIPP